jgi:hypothetical protein
MASQRSGWDADSFRLFPRRFSSWADTPAGSGRRPVRQRRAVRRRGITGHPTRLRARRPQWDGRLIHKADVRALPHEGGEPPTDSNDLGPCRSSKPTPQHGPGWRAPITFLALCVRQFTFMDGSRTLSLVNLRRRGGNMNRFQDRRIWGEKRECFGDIPAGTLGFR